MDGGSLGADVSRLTAMSRETLTRYPAFDPALPVVAFDFDGVLASNTWPSPRLGFAQREAILALQHYAEEGCEVHILTARPDSHFDRIWQWLRDQQIDHCVYDVSGRKMAASIYFDDRAVRWPLVCG